MGWDADTLYKNQRCIFIKVLIPLCAFYKYVFSKPVERRRRKASEPEDGSQLQLRDAIRGGWRLCVT